MIQCLEEGVLWDADWEGGEMHLDADPEDASWIVDPDDEDMPLAVLPTAEAAFRAWERSGEASQARTLRREEALMRLGRR